MLMWPIVANLPSPIRALVQRACGNLGHKYGGEWGYGGGSRVDVWCVRCNHYSTMTVPQAQARIPGFWKLAWQYAPNMYTDKDAPPPPTPFNEADRYQGDLP